MSTITARLLVRPANIQDGFFELHRSGSFLCSLFLGRRVAPRVSHVPETWNGDKGGGFFGGEDALLEGFHGGMRRICTRRRSSSAGRDAACFPVVPGDVNEANEIFLGRDPQAR